MECPTCKSDEITTKKCSGNGSCEGWFDHDCPSKPHIRRTCKKGHFVNVAESAEEKPKE